MTAKKAAAKKAPEPEEVVQGSGTRQGQCQGGPLNGKPGMSRFPKGFLLVDKQADTAWVYDWNGVAFICRDDEPRDLETEGRMEAADSSDWDVVAFTEGGVL